MSVKFIVWLLKMFYNLFYTLEIYSDIAKHFRASKSENFTDWKSFQR